MSETPKDVVGFSGVDATTDPFVLGQKDPTKSCMALNYRAKNGVKQLRPRYAPVLTTGATGTFKKSGVYFPYNGRAILPHIFDKYDGSFYLASTETVSQMAFTVETNIKGDYVTQGRDICKIPVSFAGTSLAVTSHLRIYTYSIDADIGSADLGKTYLGMDLAVDDSGTVEKNVYLNGTELPLDSGWHHIAISRSSDGLSIKLYLDKVYKSAFTFNNSLSGTTEITGLEPLPKDSQFKTASSSPLYYNHLALGGDSLHLADFRIWDDERTATEISANYDAELLGTEDGLVCYVPFNEGDGKYFTEKVSSARGYFSPQEPWVNDDDELVFTGYKCMAYPSYRAKYKIPAGLKAGVFNLDKNTIHTDNCEDAAYDGGILWDDKLGLASTFDYDADGVWAGTAQLRIRLRQLKEGVLCGRLGLLYDTDAQRYRLFFADYTGDAIYTSEAVVDSTWIGVEKTITVKYSGDSDDDNWDICKFWVDADEVTDSAPTTTEYNWASGDGVLDTAYAIFTGAAESDSDAPEGALGGTPADTNMCIAFDLIFFRQWWDKLIDSDEDAFVAATYNVNSLDERYRTMMTGLSGYIEDDTPQLTFTTDVGDIMGLYWRTSGVGRAYVRLPICENMVWNRGEASTNFVTDELRGLSCILVGAALKAAFKQDVLIRRIHDYDSTGDVVDILRAAKIYLVGEHFLENRRITGIVISNLVNCFDADTFRLGQEERPIYEEETGRDGLSKINNLRIMNTVIDDSPVQGIEKIGGTVYKSRYLVLGTDERYKSTWKQYSVKPRWCSGPESLVPTTRPAVRGIFRYKSEDERVNKLLAVSWNSVYSIDTSTGALTAEPWAWIERNSDAGVNFVAINNKLLIMDTKRAIKINHKGNFSRLGVERPVDLYVEQGPEHSDADPAIFSGTVDYLFGYVAQFYDSENNAYSGTIPVFEDMRQTLDMFDDTSTTRIDRIDVSFRASPDINIDGYRLYRTLNMEGVGAEDNLFLVNAGENTGYLHEFNLVQDTWTDDKLTTQYTSDKSTFLDKTYYAADMVPPPSVGASVGYGRLFLFGPETAGAALLWGQVDKTGLPHPDEMSPVSSVIVEEGGTTSGTALVEFSSQLFAFKDDSIFRIAPLGFGDSMSFGTELIYRGVGAVNQRCVVVAGNAIIFLDKNGIYRYSGGEPALISNELTDFFRDEVNKSQIDRSFVLHDKDNDAIMVFVPVGDDVTYCNRCIVGDLREGTWAIDQTPDISCGYFDDGDLYVGTPHGQVYKMSFTEYVDGVNKTRTGTGTAT